MTEQPQKPHLKRSLTAIETDIKWRLHFVLPIFLIGILTTTANSWHKLQDSLDKAQIVSAEAPPYANADLRLAYISGQISTRETVREPFADTPLPYAAAILIDSRYSSCVSRNKRTLSAAAAKAIMPVNLTIAGYLVWYRMVNDNMDELVLPVDLSTLPQIVTNRPELGIMNNTLYERLDGEAFVRGESLCGHNEHKLYYIPKGINVTLIGWLHDDEKEGRILTSSPLLAKKYDGVAPYGIKPSEVVEQAGKDSKPVIMLCAFGFYALVLLQIRPLDRLAVPHNPLSLWRVNLLGFASTIMTVGYFDRISNAFLAILALLGSILLLYIILRVTQRAKNLPST